MIPLLIGLVFVSWRASGETQVVDASQVRAGVLPVPGTIDGEVSAADESVRYDLEYEPNVSELMLSVSPEAQFEPDVVLFDDEGEVIRSAVGFSLLPGEPPYLLADVDPTTKQHVRIAGRSGTTGEFVVSAEEAVMAYGDLSVGRAIHGEFTEGSEVDIYRLTASTDDLLLLRLESEERDPFHWMGVSAAGGGSQTFVFDSQESPDERAEPLIAVNPSQPGDVFYVVLVARPEATGPYTVSAEHSAFDVNALTAKFLGDHSIVFKSGGTSGNCIPWDFEELDRQLTLSSQRTADGDSVWLWDTKFASRAGVESYRATFDGGWCFLSDGRVIWSGQSEFEDGYVIWYATGTLMEPESGIIDSVGVVIASGLTVREAQVWETRVDELVNLDDPSFPISLSEFASLEEAVAATFESRHRCGRYGSALP